MRGLRAVQRQSAIGNRQSEQNARWIGSIRGASGQPDLNVGQEDQIWLPASNQRAWPATSAFPTLSASPAQSEESGRSSPCSRVHILPRCWPALKRRRDVSEQQVQRSLLSESLWCRHSIAQPNPLPPSRPADRDTTRSVRPRLPTADCRPPSLPPRLLISRQLVTRIALPRRQEIELSEFLIEPHRLVDDALLLVVVAHLEITGHREIPAQGMPVETVIGEDAPEIWVV